jgi:hypothetical protein
LAFPEDYTASLYDLDMFTNGIFCVDMIIQFARAYYDKELKVVDDFKVRRILKEIKIQSDKKS